MSNTYEVISKIDGQPTFETPLPEILSSLEVGGGIKTFGPTEWITEQQRRWFKGVLLKALAKHTGDSVEYWETRLKTAILPDEFKPFYISFGKQVFPVLPSITKLSVKKMNVLIEGSVAHLRDEKVYGDEFLWVTLPDPALRKQW
jgi:hypothetical protein